MPTKIGARVTDRSPGDQVRGPSVLVVNSGSSSLKFALVDPATGRRQVEGLAERLGTDEATLRTRSGTADEVQRDLPGASHRAIVNDLLGLVADTSGGVSGPIGVGHRVVHGGDRFSDSVRIDASVMSAIEHFSALAPLHNPPALQGIRAVSEVAPELPQVAVFDTAFHQSMPPSAYRYAVPQQWYTEYGVRRYGFHGTSHRFVAARAAEILGQAATELNLITAHLGNGCSAAAIRGGRSVDTTMGLTPLEGLVMGTRSGDIDPAVFEYLQDQAGLDVAAVTTALNSDSGLLGLSGASNDLRTIEAMAADGDEAAELALEVFVHRLAKALAGLVSTLGGLDALVFTGGIGQHSSLIRERTLARLGFLGLSCDRSANDVHGADTHGRISQSGPTLALVVPTDEELLIARDTIALIQPTPGGTP